MSYLDRWKDKEHRVINKETDHTYSFLTWQSLTAEWNRPWDVFNSVYSYNRLITYSQLGKWGNGVGLTPKIIVSCIFFLLLCS